MGIGVFGCIKIILSHCCVRSKSNSMLILVLALFWCVSSSGQQHLVCKNIEDVFTDDALAETRPRHRGIQGPPGKMGSKGERGIRGLPGTEGSPGRVDYDRVDDVIEEKITNSWSVMNSAISELKRNLSALLPEWEELKPILTEMKRKHEEAATAAAAAAAEAAAAEAAAAEAAAAEAAAAAAEDDCRRRGGLLHSGKCFTIPHMSSPNDMNHDQAVVECAKHGALLAEIHDRDQQSTLYEFAVTKMPAGSLHVEIWFGMEYKHSTLTLLYLSGMEMHSNQLQWYPGYPSSSYKYVIMDVKNVGSSGDFGLYNYIKSSRLNGVMCEKET